MLRIRPLGHWNRILLRNVRNGGAGDLGRSALVIAPHQDDETLGCGGTIIRKRRAGARVTMVFVSDGRRSHAHLMPPEELSAIRRDEALAAAQRLGVGRENVRFLSYREGELGAHRAAIVKNLEEVIGTCRPAELFVPYRRDGHADHVVTQQVTLAALKRSKRGAVVYEYPIWAWAHWPWISLRLSLSHTALEAVKAAIAGAFGLPILGEFRHAVRIRDVLEQKWDALRQYRSQMTRLVPDPAWKTLHDVGGGEFLACHFRGYEVFRRYTVRGDEAF